VHAPKALERVPGSPRYEPGLTADALHIHKGFHTLELADLGEDKCLQVLTALGVRESGESPATVHELCIL
jgi:hypothetical protein